jgi:hypothetical protein
MLTAMLAARAGDEKLALTALAANVPETTDGQHPILTQMRIVAEAELLRAKGDNARALAKLQPLVDGTELCLVHQSLLDVQAATGNAEAALKEANWLAEHRGRAYAEYNVQRILVPLNVVQSDLALLRAAELAKQLGKKEDGAKYLSRFRQAWPDAAKIDFVSPRLGKLTADSGADSAPAGA